MSLLIRAVIKILFFHHPKCCLEISRVNLPTKLVRFALRLCLDKAWPVDKEVYIVFCHSGKKIKFSITVIGYCVLFWIMHPTRYLSSWVRYLKENLPLMNLILMILHERRKSAAILLYSWKVFSFLLLPDKVRLDDDESLHSFPILCSL